MPRRIAILDPSNRLSQLAHTFNEVEGTHAARVRSLEALVVGVEEDAWDLVVVDWAKGEEEAVITELLAASPALPIVVTSDHGDVQTAQRAIGLGAVDFLVRGERLGERVRTQLGKIRRLYRLIERNKQLTQHVRELDGAPRIFGVSSALRQVVHAAEVVAQIPRPVMILGERGTGKELIARHIHAHAGADERPFVAVNCAAVSDSLLENELFGHERGSYTGADQRSPGRFEQADGGTLFLDEIGNMSMPFQRALLRVVEYGQFQRVGSARVVSVHTRIVAATNADLVELMNRGKFMRDLYDRLSFEVIQIPPLRERPSDIELLARHFLSTFQQEFYAELDLSFSADALQALREHPFPGNVRELKNLVERACFHDLDGVIDVHDLGLTRRSVPRGSFKEKLRTYEAGLIRDALAQCGGNQAAAARLLELPYHQLRYYAQKHGLG